MEQTKCVVNDGLKPNTINYHNKCKWFKPLTEKAEILINVCGRRGTYKQHTSNKKQFKIKGQHKDILYCH